MYLMNIYLWSSLYLMLLLFSFLFDRRIKVPSVFSISTSLFFLYWITLVITSIGKGPGGGTYDWLISCMSSFRNSSNSTPLSSSKINLKLIRCVIRRQKNNLNEKKNVKMSYNTRQDVSYKSDNLKLYLPQTDFQWT